MRHGTSLPARRAGREDWRVSPLLLVPSPLLGPGAWAPVVSGWRATGHRAPSSTRPRCGRRTTSSRPSSRRRRPNRSCWCPTATPGSAMPAVGDAGRRRAPPSSSTRRCRWHGETRWPRRDCWPARGPRRPGRAAAAVDAVVGRPDRALPRRRDPRSDRGRAASPAAVLLHRRPCRCRTAGRSAACGYLAFGDTYAEEVAFARSYGWPGRCWTAGTCTSCTTQPAVGRAVLDLVDAVAV